MIEQKIDYDEVMAKLQKEIGMQEKAIKLLEADNMAKAEEIDSILVVITYSYIQVKRQELQLELKQKRKIHDELQKEYKESLHNKESVKNQEEKA